MPPKHTERAFEDAIEHSLLTEGGFTKGSAAAFDRALALHPEDFLAFVRETQAERYADLSKQHGAGLDAALVDHLVKALEARGTLDVLRHGFKFFGKTIDGAYFPPSHQKNPDVLERVKLNRLVLTRQVHFAPAGHADAAESVDLLLSLNGLPVATAELKNQLTGQTVEDGIAQYRRRDARHRLFQFKKRAVVHFAVDPHVVYMTTKLEGEATAFLPFNRGNAGGAGNPEHESGVRTAYLWEEALARDSFLDIVGRFVHQAKEEPEEDETGAKRGEAKVRLVFPRYHQLDAVRKLEAAARSDGPGAAYLIQHSAGSGKSNSIAWLAHRLANLHDDADEKVFDSVVVITDRRVLDRQLQANVYEIEHRSGFVAKIDEHSDQLAEALLSGVPIVITTLQKFPFVTEKIAGAPSRRYAVIVDEAHSSQTGEAARQMKQALAEGDEPEDAEAVMREVVASRGRQKNLSFFAFTATPKAKTLELFGVRDAEGNPRPFHLYSMRQAIEENFILDVLRSYTTYKAYYRLVKAIEDDPRVPKKEATRQLGRFMSLHPHNVAQKTAVMVEHFRSSVRSKIGGRAKAMLVTSSRLHAVRYKRAFEQYIAEQGYTDVGVLVAFSGAVTDPDTGIEYTEPGMNVGKDGRHVSEAGLAKAFKRDEFRLLLVANKYQTGFDQPLLHTMYVDKRLSGVQAVQTLSRLNRKHPLKEDTFVLDFVNDAEEIERSFQPYYEATTVADEADPQQLYDLQHQLEEAQIFWRSEVEAFCKVFYAPRKKQTVRDHSEMNRHLIPAVDRYKKRPEEERDEFRNRLGAFVRLYSFLSQVMPFSDLDLEKLYTFARFLELSLPRDPRKAPLDLDGDVALKYYRLEKIREGAIPLRAGEPGLVYGPAEVGTKKVTEDEAQLSEIIEVLNDRFGTEFTAAHQVFVDAIRKHATNDADVRRWATSNTLENFALPMQKKIEEKMVELLDSGPEIAEPYFRDPEFRAVIFRALVRTIYDEVRDGEPVTT